MYIVAAVIMIAGTVASMMLTKTPGVDNYRSQSERKQVLRASASPKTAVYGKTMSAGTLFFSEEQSGEQDDGELLYLAITLAGHPLYRIGDIHLADDLIGTYGSNVGYEFHNDRQTVDPYLLENAPSWKDDMIGKGVAWLRLTLKFDSEKFPSGIPNVKVEKWGWEVYDPRTGNTTWSDNAALVILHYYRYYLKVPDSEINWEQFEVAANISDESVIRGDGNTERRYTINGEFDLSENKSAILDDMLTSCAGEPTYIGGRHGLLVGAYYGPAVEEIHEGQIAGDIEIMPEVSQSDRVNTINGTFIDPEQSYSEADFPAVSVPEWVAEDGVEISQDMKLRFVTSEFQGQRLADIKLKRARVARTINLPMNLSGYRYRPGMYVKLFLPSLGIDGIEMRVADWQFSIQNGVKLTLKQEGADVWNDAVGKLIDRAPLTNLPNGAPGAPENLSYSTQIIADVVQGLLTWTTRETVAHYNVLFIQNGATIYTAQVPGTQCRVTGLPEGEYIAEVRAVAMNGAQSVPVSITFKINAPAAPDRVDVTPGLWSVELHPRVVAGLPVGTVFEFWFSAERLSNISLVETNADYLGRGASYTKVGLKEVGKVYWFYVRSVNSYGASAFVEVGASVDSDVAPIFEEAAEIVFETDAWKSLTDDVENNSQQLVEQAEQIAGGMLTSIEQARAIIRNSLANDSETRRWRAQNGERTAEISETRAAVASEVEARTIAILEMESSIGSTNSNLNALQQTVTTLEQTTAQDIAELQSQIADVDVEGLATIVDGLETTVTQQGDTITSQGSQITQITASVNTAQNTANAAQQAATDAATAAGNKGRVIYGSTAPAATDRLAQNLWIDTTGNANTPKRWNGSAWVAVTDKAATDAAAAANAAANVAATAQSTADGAVQSVNSVSATVTQQGNTIASQGTQISQLTSTINGVSTEISDVSSIVNGIGNQLSAFRTIKVSVDANGRQYLAGIGLDVSNSTTGMQSNIILLADRTSIMTNAGGTPTMIFTTQGTHAILNSVVIGDATITSAKIADTLQSTGFGVIGQGGWSITKSTNAFEVDDENNIIRFRAGKLS
ncbi:DUF1983 domain-containing protein [Brenneria sp. MC1SB4.1]|uniref:DUF1983 domain-containing protein n=2 Tax=Brenneria tiliae TaxID=2914984 RepID=A0ABT0MRJ6_9GAMM|nr:DUF1983 domain-containing protein [Brenneria tiliae]